MCTSVSEMCLLNLLIIVTIFVGGVKCIDCRSGWIIHEESCYHFSNEDQPWVLAQVMCKQFRGYLAEINTRSEDVFLHNHVNELNDGHFWVGGTDLENEDEWKWITSDNQFDYTNWGPEEPNQDRRGVEEDCVDLKLNLEGWNDESCTTSQRYICEQSDTFMEPEIVG